MSAPLASLLHFGAKKVPSRSTHRSSSVGDDRRISKNCVLGLRKGAWSEEEDMLLKKCIAEYGERNWHKVPIRSGLNRCRKSCRLRWLNYLHPNINRGEFGSDEVDLIIKMHNLLGNRWSLIAGRLPGRTANDVKNYWNTHLNKKAASPRIKEAAKPHLETKKEAQLFRPRPWTFSKNSKWLKRVDEASHEVLVSEEAIAVGTPPMQFDKNTISWLEHVLIHGEEEDQVGILDSTVEEFFKSSSSNSSVEDMELKDSYVGTLSTHEEDITAWFDDELCCM